MKAKYNQLLLVQPQKFPYFVIQQSFWKGVGKFIEGVHGKSP